MREHYQQQVSLLLEVLPFVAKSEVFALKGGTAINFFYLDCPRFSVDIDLHYLPLNDRDTALPEIEVNMRAIAASILRAFSETDVRVDPNTFNAVVARMGTQIKIEPNTVIRGSVLPVEKKALSPHLEQTYGRSVTISCVAKYELYAGKLCAALQRQHPRDLFDILLFLRNNSLTQEMMDVFLVYLISQGKPVNEILNPNQKKIEQLFRSQFTGMSTEDVVLESLIDIQNTLPKQVVAALTDDHREFLIGFKSGIPDWSLLPFDHIQNLPAVRWKQQNLEKMDSIKRGKAIDKLQKIFEAIPYNPAQSWHRTEKEQPVMLTPQEQLAKEIVSALVEHGLLSKAGETRIRQQFAAGKLTREDWSLLIELASESTPNVSGVSND